jgi:hypothetical protein
MILDISNGVTAGYDHARKDERPGKGIVKTRTTEFRREQTLIAVKGLIMTYTEDR